MGQRSFAILCCCLGALLLPLHTAGAGELFTPVQTQSTSPPGVLVATNWGPGTPGVNSPLSFEQFNPKLGKLEEIDITLKITVRNDYELIFINASSIGVATSATTDLSILSDPAKRAELTDGPTVTLFAPNGTDQLFGPPATRQPVDFVQLTETSGTFSSLLPITDPNFIPPTMTEQSFTRALTDTNAPSVFSDFIGTGMVALPVTAAAASSFFSSSGNGGGGVLTKANAIVSIQYGYIPEPSSFVLLALGISLGSLAFASRRRTTSPDRSDRK
jgi:hypothetical protein